MFFIAFLAKVLSQHVEFSQNAILFDMAIYIEFYVSLYTIPIIDQFTSSSTDSYKRWRTRYVLINLLYNFILPPNNEMSGKSPGFIMPIILVPQHEEEMMLSSSTMIEILLYSYPFNSHVADGFLFALLSTKNTFIYSLLLFEKLWCAQYIIFDEMEPTEFEHCFSGQMEIKYIRHFNAICFGILHRLFDVTESFLWLSGLFSGSLLSLRENACQK